MFIGSSLIRVKGNRGVGITSILAKVFQNLSKRSPRMCLIPCFKEVCHSALGLLTYLYEELLKSANMEIPNMNEMEKSTIDQVASNIVTLLSSLKHSGSQNCTRTVIFMDGLASCLDNSSNTKVNLLNWLPLRIPDFLTVIVSTDNSTKWKASFDAKSDKLVTLNVPELQISKRKEVLRDFLSKHGKVLDEQAFNNQLQQIALKKDSGKAGYLKLVAQELLSHGYIDNMTDHVNKIGQTSQLASVQILARLRENYGSKVFSVVTGILLVGSQFGKINRELLFLISEAMVPDVSDLRINIILLLQELENIILSTDLLKNQIELTNVEVLSDYFKDRNIHLDLIRQTYISILTSKYYNQGPSSLFDPNVLLALPFHLSTNASIKELQSLLDIRFICLSAEAKIIKSIKPFFNGSLIPGKRERDKFLSSKTSQAYSEFINRNQTILCNGGAMSVIQKALEEPLESLIHQDALTYLRTMVKADIWCMKVKRYSRRTGDILSSYKLDKMSTLTVSVVEKVNHKKLNEIYHAHGFSDGTVILCRGIDVEGENHLIGHSSSITSLCFVPGKSYNR